MPQIRNSALIKRFTDFFKLKVSDGLTSQAGRMLEPVVNLPLPANILEVLDIVANDSNKTITVPAGKRWKVLYGNVKFVTTASVGNRKLRFRIFNGSSNDLWSVVALNVQTASTTEFYNIQIGAPDASEAVGTRHIIPFPNESILEAGFIIQIDDQAAVDAAADDMSIFLIVEETDITGE